MQQELEVIMDLMKDLQEKMEYGEEDFSERLGRKKPSLEVVKVEAEAAPEMGMEGEEPELEIEEEMPESPEEKLKNRLMKMRA